MPVRRILTLAALAAALAAAVWGLLGYAHWQRDRQEAALVNRAVRYAVEQFSPAYLKYIREQRKAPRDNMDLGLAPPRDTLWVGLTRAELYPNGDLHLEYESPEAGREPLLVWHIDARDNALAGPRLCGARDIPERVLAWNGLECDADVATPARDAPIPALRLLALPARPVAPTDEILEAVHRNDAARLAALREEGRDLCAVSPENFTALGEAARGDQAKTIPVLAAACDVDQVEPFSGQTALMIAASKRNADTVHALLTAGADPNMATDDGDTAWFLLGTGNDEPSRRIRLMLTSKGTALDSVAGDGATLLMRAAAEGNTELVGWLLQGGANIDLQDRAGRSAVMYATLSPRGALALQLLIARNADLKLRDAEGKTALELARTIPDERRGREVTQLLKTAGAAS